MQALVVYDSQYGNTEAIAQAIAEALPGDTRISHVSETVASQLKVDLLIVGSPTQGGRPTPAIKNFLADIGPDALKGVTVAAFDTRISANKHGMALRLLVGLLGYAAGRIAGSLKSKGGDLAAPPEGFAVEAKEGTLEDGELERAGRWAKLLVGTRVPA